MTELRTHFHDELERLEHDLVLMGEHAGQMISDSVAALVASDFEAAQGVIDKDDVVDDLYLEVHQRWLATMALQTPVAIDLRLMSVILHVNSHLERIADLAVTIAKITELSQGLPHDPTVISHLQEMGDMVASMVRTVMEAFTSRDLESALELPEMDRPVNRLNRKMVRKVVKFAEETDLLEWGVRMMVVSRTLERAGDNAVDVAEQIAFLLTGEFREFTDASHHD
ncbi:MAG: phosphate signaling complex protein PhoU [Acidimicrobiia bacterium]|nr:phosphate signaling complex protein PhoU [Acidimicrobiia bacterium]MBT8194693.1 phosphate signaling complex protein PhoU [Acidimicrobiia bacterium]MBT8247594.1 phosphate signaling complex protein PhoU [Acidimicrobiia bacterium]NNF89263.1 phosphate signaling complex protein PhoU [Acidimicrobiia bacterium]NNL12636.1 phosphate signaling complex protein PhoU [Acidimicrobiia bacterium]